MPPLDYDDVSDTTPVAPAVQATELEHVMYHRREVPAPHSVTIQEEALRTVQDEETASAPPASPNTSLPQNESIPRIIINLLTLGLPLNVSQVAQLSILLVMMSAIGTFGTNALGGASLANGLMNATGYAFGAGLSGALETLLSHSFGHNPKSLLYGTHAQRMSLLLLVVAVPLGCVIAHIGAILLRLGQPAQVVVYTADYALVGLWALIPFMLLEVLRRYYAAQHLSTSFTVAMVLGAAVNVPLQQGLTGQLGFIGAPIAWMILLIAMDAGLIMYLLVTGLYRDTWGGWNRSALCHWGPMLRLAIPSLAMTMCEWTALEVNTVLAGFAPPIDLATFAITVQMAITMWTMPSGNYIAASVLVGNRIGERRPILGRTYAVCALIVSFIIAWCNVFGVLALGERLPRFFSENPLVIERFMKWRWWVIAFHFGDSFQSTMLGIFRGMGRQVDGAKVVGLSFGVVGVPIGLGLFFSGMMDVQALWLGPLVGVYAVGGPLFCYYFRKTEWALLEPHAEEVPKVILLEEEEMTTN
jgi:multidrug resistance protein, MATE family